MTREDLILGIDTSSLRGSIGLIRGEQTVASSSFRPERGHSGSLPMRIRDLVEESSAKPKELAGIGVSNGPGSFTALRVGVATAQGLGLGLGVPVVPVGSLEVVAAGLPGEIGKALVLVPARKNEVFAQRFEYDSAVGWMGVDVVSCVKVEELLSVAGETRFVAGPAIDLYSEEITALLGKDAVFAEPSCRYARGDVAARIAGKAIRAGSETYSAENVTIRYLQSHGALTIKEREGRP